MNTYPLIQETVQRHPGHYFPGMTLATLMAGLALQEYLPVRPAREFEFTKIWQEVGMGTAIPLVDEIAASHLIDRAMAVEVARRIYMARCVEWTRVDYLFYNVAFWEVFGSEGGLEERDALVAWDYAIHYMRRQKDRLQGMSVIGASWQERQKVMSEMTQMAFDAMEEELGRNYNPSRLNQMRKSIAFLMERVSMFVAANGTPRYDNNPLHYEFIRACLAEVFNDDTMVDQAMVIITGSAENPTYEKFKASLKEYQ